MELEPVKTELDFERYEFVIRIPEQLLIMAFGNNLHAIEHNGGRLSKESIIEILNVAGVEGDTQ